MSQYRGELDPTLLLQRCSPLPKLPFVPYLSSRRQDVEPRPQPPTPASTRIEYDEQYLDFATMTKAQDQRKSFSSIPRRSTDLTNRVPKSCLTKTQILSPEMARRPQPRYPTAQKSGINSTTSQKARPEPLLPKLQEFDSLEETFRGSSISSTLSSEPIGQAITVTNTDGDTAAAQPHLPRSFTYDTFVTTRRNEAFARPDADASNTAFRRARSPYPSSTSAGARSMSSITYSPWSSDQETSFTSEKSLSSEREADPRFVCEARPPQYWLGRYTTQLDRLRSCELLSKSSNESGSQKTRTSKDFDKFESKLKLEALGILKSFCDTRSAKNSFEQFAADLRRKDHDLWSTGRNEIWREANKPLEILEYSKPKHHDNNARTRKPSDTLPHGIFRKSITSSKPQMSKSATFSSLTTIHPTNEVESQRTGQTQKQQRRYSMRPSSPTRPANNKIRAVSDGVSKAPVQFARLRSPVPPGLVRRTEPSFDTNTLERTMRVILPWSSIRSRSPTPNATLEESDGGSSPATLISEAEAGTRTALRDISTIPRGRRFKKSESMMKFVDAGIREIKRMGHRASHTSSIDDT